MKLGMKIQHVELVSTADALLVAASGVKPLADLARKKMK